MEGSGEGAEVGEDDGEWEMVGMELGRDDGVAEGPRLCSADGPFVGDPDGLALGVPLGDESRKGYYCAPAATGRIGAPCQADNECADPLATCLRAVDEHLERIVVDVETPSSVQTRIAVARTRASPSNQVGNLQKSKTRDRIQVNRK